MAEWRPVVGYEGIYQVSDEGQVRSVNRLDAAGHSLRGRVMKQNMSPRGYLQVALCRDGRLRTRWVHQLVAEAFCGARPEGAETRHLNGARTDNRAVNLAWATSSINKLDQVRHGTHANAAKTHCPRGHEYVAENIIVTSHGSRRCRTCEEARSRARAAARTSLECGTEARAA